MRRSERLVGTFFRLLTVGPRRRPQHFPNACFHLFASIIISTCIPLLLLSFVGGIRLFALSLLHHLQSTASSSEHLHHRELVAKLTIATNTRILRQYCHRMSPICHLQDHIHPTLRLHQEHREVHPASRTRPHRQSHTSTSTTLATPRAMAAEEPRTPKVKSRDG